MDCVFNKGNSCLALSVNECPEECRFYKTEIDFQKSLNKSKERLRSLPTLHQLEISDKYYVGRMPWYDERRTKASLKG